MTNGTGPPHPPGLTAENIVKSVTWLGPLIGLVAFAAVAWNSLQNNIENMQGQVAAMQLSLSTISREFRVEIENKISYIKNDASKELLRTEADLRQEIKRTTDDNVKADAATASSVSNLISAISVRLTEVSSQIASERDRVNDFIDKRYNPHMDDARERLRLTELKQMTFENELSRIYHALDILQETMRTGKQPAMPPGDGRHVQPGSFNLFPFGHPNTAIADVPTP